MQHDTQEPASERRKQLFVLRHAKSSWSQPGVADFDRPLNARGQRAAPRMGAHLAQALDAPLDCVLVSSARRTQQTWELLGLSAQLTRPPLVLDRLYGASAQIVAQLVADYVWPKARRVLVIGHNPGLQDFCIQAALPGAEAAHFDAFARLESKFPTAALASFRMRGAWQALASTSEVGLAGMLALESFVTPRSLDECKSAFG